jgi:hypothetical protein
MTTKAVVIVWLTLLATDRVLDVFHAPQAQHEEMRR